MKKLNLYIIVFLMIIVLPVNTYANGVEFYVTNSRKNDINEIKEQFDDLLKDMDVVPKGKSIEDFEIDKFMQIYIGADVFKNENISEEELRNVMENLKTYWAIQYNNKDSDKNLGTQDKVKSFDFDVIKVHNILGRRKRFDKLSDEQIKFYEKNGKWVVQSYAENVYKYHKKDGINYILKKYNITPKTLYILDSPGFVRGIYATYFDEKGKINFINIRECQLVYAKEIYGIVEENYKPDYKIFYTYEEMKKKSEEIKLDANPNIMGSGNSSSNQKETKKENKRNYKTIIYASVAIILILGISFVVIKKRKK
ncbi:hypothetical protein ABGF49_07540 [Helcococcus ovis]|uniref:hypothetical protein n=1 Tax=Helcococcus TaxID=31983 RepID=UPI0038B8BA18